MENFAFVDSGFPALAGIDPSLLLSGDWRLRFPRVGGDRPAVKQ